MVFTIHHNLSQLLRGKKKKYSVGPNGAVTALQQGLHASITLQVADKFHVATYLETLQILRD